MASPVTDKRPAPMMGWGFHNNVIKNTICLNRVAIQIDAAKFAATALFSLFIAVNHARHTGIGISSATVPPQVDNDTRNRKVVMNEAAGNPHAYCSLGVSFGIFGYRVPEPADAPVFYAGWRREEKRRLFSLWDTGKATLTYRPTQNNDTIFKKNLPPVSYTNSCPENTKRFAVSLKNTIEKL